MGKLLITSALTLTQGSEKGRFPQKLDGRDRQEASTLERENRIAIEAGNSSDCIRSGLAAQWLHASQRRITIARHRRELLLLKWFLDNLFLSAEPWSVSGR